MGLLQSKPFDCASTTVSPFSICSFPTVSFSGCLSSGTGAGTPFSSVTILSDLDTSSLIPTSWSSIWNLSFTNSGVQNWLTSETQTSKTIFFHLTGTFSSIVEPLFTKTLITSSLKHTSFSSTSDFFTILPNLSPIHSKTASIHNCNGTPLILNHAILS
ncbi:hypothetical protein HanIR_Chr01g0004931 [Helianthus annuus]|nr:hypothetical protein HanIR_Chr01g0004931 [Helianthus annuus]